MWYFSVFITSEIHLVKRLLFPCKYGTKIAGIKIHCFIGGLNPRHPDLPQALTFSVFMATCSVVTRCTKQGIKEICCCFPINMNGPIRSFFHEQHTVFAEGVICWISFFGIKKSCRRFEINWMNCFITRSYFNKNLFSAIFEAEGQPNQLIHTVTS